MKTIIFSFLFGIMSMLNIVSAQVNAPCLSQQNTVQSLNTGVNNVGTVLANGALEQHWAVPNPNFVVSNYYSTTWAGFPTNSEFVSFAAAASNTTYTFRRNFCVDACDTSTLNLNFRMWADNSACVFLDGITPIPLQWFSTSATVGTCNEVIGIGQTPFLPTGGYICNQNIPITPGSHFIEVRVNNIGERSALKISGNMTLTTPNCCPQIQIGITGNTRPCSDKKTLICATATGGVAPYTYNWSNGVPASCVTLGGVNNTYIVIATDANGCTASLPVVISMLPLPVPTLTATALSCNPPSIATLTAGGGTSYNFGTGFTPTNTQTVATAGIYTVTVQGANTCTASTTVSVAPVICCPNSILPNGGFENNTVVTGSSNLNAGTTTNNWTVAFLTPQVSGPGNTGSFAAYMWGLGNPNSTPSWVGEGISNTGITYTPNQTYTVTFRAKHHNNIARPQLPTAQFRIAGIATPFNVPVSTPSWQTYTFNFCTPSTPTNQFQVIVTNQMASATDGAFSSWIGIDDICIEPYSCPTIQIGITGKRELCPTDKSNLCATANGGTAPYTYSWSTGANTSCTNITGANCPAGCSSVYTVIVTDANCCTASQTIVVTTLPSPVITASASPAIITSGGSSTLSASGATFYVWLPMGVNTNPVTVSPTVTTTYTVVAFECGKPCPARKSVIVKVKQIWVGTDINIFKDSVNQVLGKTIQAVTTEVDAIEKNDTQDDILTVSPNPTNNIVKINLKNWVPNNKTVLTIADISGRTISTEAFLENNTDFDFSDYPDGIYILSLKNETGMVISKKIIKQ